MQNNSARFHSIQRTSPKGPGQPFIGTCTLCGKAGLPASATREYCENTRGLTQDEALVEAILGPAATLQEGRTK